MQEFINFATVLVVAVCVAGMISTLPAPMGSWGPRPRRLCAHYAARGVGDLLRRVRVHRAVRSVAHDSNFPLNNSRNSLFERLK